MKPSPTLLRIFVMLAFIAALVPTYPARAAEPKPPSEIFSPGPCTAGSAPSDLMTTASTVYFTAYEDLHGREIYQSDGTQAGTWRVTELAPGIASLDPDLRIVVGGKLYFTTKEQLGAAHPKQRLWVTDGTPAAVGSTGATMLLDFWPETSEYSISALAELNGMLYFIIRNHSIYQYEARAELWRTDGADSGTQLVKAYAPYPTYNDEPEELIAYNGYLYFTGTIDPYRNELYRSDGTPGGTGPFGGLYWPYRFTISGGYLYFISSAGLYRTDGSTTGTTKVITLPSGASIIGGLTDLNGRVFFSMINNNQGELWLSDGSAAGTKLIKSFGNYLYDTTPMELTAVGNTLFFSAAINESDREIWKTDGTPAGTVQVKDLKPGPYGSIPKKLKAFGGKVYFITTNLSMDAVQLWSSDGSSTGTQLIQDSTIFPMDGSIGEIAIASNRLFYSSVVPCSGQEMQSLTSDNPVLQLATDINTTLATTRVHYSIANLGGQGFFFANDYVHGFELWRSDGTAQGTRMVKDINPTGSANIDLAPVMVTAGPFLYFNVGSYGQADLWRTDGSAAGTQPVKLSDGSAIQTDLFCATAFKNQLYYFTRAYLGYDLWKTDGTPYGTQKVATLPNRGNGVELNSKLYYLVGPSDSEQQLWVTDGSMAGTMLVRSLEWSSTIKSSPSGLLRIGNRLYFLGWDARGVQPWVTDGTYNGTHILTEVTTASTLHIAGSNDTLYILARDNPGYRLWTNHGAVDGSLTLLRESTTNLITNNQSTSGKFFFIETNANQNNPLLWASDGTVAGTFTLLADGSAMSGASLFPATSTVFFAATDAAGQELWQSDGTIQGTHRVADIWPGPESSQPWIRGFDGARLYFSAADGSTADRQVPGSIFYAYNTLTEQLFLPFTAR